MIESTIAILFCLIGLAITLVTIFRDRVNSEEGRRSLKIALVFVGAACLLSALILWHGPVPEDHIAAEAQSVTESDN